MMKLRIWVVGLTVLVLSTVPASAQWYVSGHIGPNFQSDSLFVDLTDGDALVADFDVGFLFGFEGGMTIAKKFRVGGEITHRGNDVDNFKGGANLFGAEMSSWAFMGNFWWDIPVRGKFRPYIGGGVGLANVSAEGINSSGVTVIDDSDTVFAFQFGVGVGFEVMPKVEITAEYRYFTTSDPEFGVVEAEYTTHSLLFGGRYRF